MKRYFVYHGKYSNTYRIASAEDEPTVRALLSDGWEHITLAEIKKLRKRESVVEDIATAYIDINGALVVIYYI